ncbi:unnamed protein product [Diatraea saccharalis]|uniref:Tc1-like transposase DDE domain-containing protein n=1 Tax=Diatraea saccharalis TaxID=40085 RepID=A0A9N9R595_9NEOP|nr:unnamed protein product [Diatraea saccharalis]
MSKPIKSSSRKLLSIMIDKFTEVKTELNKNFMEKLQRLDKVVSFLDNCDGDIQPIMEEINAIKTLEKQEMLNSETQYLQKISSMTDVSIRTLRRIKNEALINKGKWDTPGKKRPHQPTVSALDNFDLSAIRNKVNEFYCVKKIVPTLRSLHNELKDAIGFSGSRETLRKIMLKNGFSFKSNENERSMLIEKYQISAWRHKYLREINIKRNEEKQIVYLDETYVHQNYKVKKSWQGPSTTGVTTKISSGKRHIVVHAGSEEGFVPGALLVFSSKSKSADYHDDMNSSNFMKWVREKLIPNLSKPSVIVMDNASYHIKQINKPPIMSNTKADIRKWLVNNGIHFEEYQTKAELMCLVNDKKTLPVYEAEEILKEHNHELLLLPPYHCDLNPIEMVWSQAKRKIASRNIGIPGKEMENLIVF